MGVVVSTPDDHFAAGPYRNVILSGKGGIRGTSRYPTVRARVISPACVKIDRRIAADPSPDYHFAAGPHRRVRFSWGGGVGGAGSHPTIAGRIVSAASVAIVKRGVGTSPDDHFTAAPYRGVTSAAQYIIRDSGGRPTVVGRVILAAGV